MNETITIKDIAKKAGVSVGTVSGILNNKANFAKDTKDRVWNIVHELSYKPNQDAKRLGAGRFGNRPKTSITMYISNTDNATPENNPMERLCLSVLCSEFQKHSMFMTKYWYQGIKRFSCPPILNGLVDGVILATPYIETVNEINAKGIPLVLIDSPFHSTTTSTPTVNFNCRKGVHEMFRKLKEHGHRNIGICYSPSVMEAPVYGAMVEASVIYGIKIQSEFLKPMDINPSIHDKVMHEFANFTERFVRERKITALFCTHDIYALSLYDIFKAKGIDIPSELSLIGHGRVDLDLVKSPVATIAKDWHELSRVAVELLKSIIDGKEISSSVEMMINPVIYYGQSIQGVRS